MGCMRVSGSGDGNEPRMGWQEGREAVLKAVKKVEADLGGFKLDCLGSSGYGFEAELDAKDPKPKP